jgi:hypothetical protein
MGRAWFFLFSLWLFLTKVEAIDLSAAGGWNENVNASDLVSGVGSNLVDTYESTTNATNVNISNCMGDSDNWRVDVRRVDEGGWYGGFALYVKRTSDGTGNGFVSDGFDYIEITSTDTPFFTGAGDRSNINIQYQLTGMSINVSPNNYHTTIMFTVVDIP